MSRQIALIVRWHEDAVRLSTRLLAAACFDHSRFAHGVNALEDDFMSFQSLATELTVEVIDVLHEFCFVLRKLIERADLVGLARDMYPHSHSTSVVIRTVLGERQVQLCDKSLWWLLGRVIHSNSLTVVGGDGATSHVYADSKVREFGNGRLFVEVASDFDSSAGHCHLIHIPSLVRLYADSMLRHKIDAIVAANTL
jgi:hypothetical protein